MYAALCADGDGPFYASLYGFSPYADLSGILHSIGIRATALLLLSRSPYHIPFHDFYSDVTAVRPS